jgi:lipoprotein-anchoring transpeptidase ErfK/SrfK
MQTPLGTAASHGCVRLENAAVDAIVRNAGLRGLLGVPVIIRA